MTRSFPAAGYCCVALVLTTATVARAEGNRFSFADAEVFSGSSTTVTVFAEHERSAQGFSFAATFPNDALTIDRIHPTDTIIEALGADVFRYRVDEDEGYFSLAVLVDAEPPFEGGVLPALPFPLEMFHVDVTVAAGVEHDLELEQVDGLGTPPIFNLFAVDDHPVPVDELASGTIRVRPHDLFLRGDASMDEQRDITDVVIVLDYSFLGGREPGCMDAADANDDERVDVSDAILLLNYLYLGSGRMPPPAAGIGEDPTPDALDCEEPILRVFGPV